MWHQQETMNQIQCVDTLEKKNNLSTDAAAAAAKSLQSCPTLCDPIDGSPSGSTIAGILQARTLEWVAISFSRASSWPRNRTQVSRIAGTFFNSWATREAHSTAAAAKLLQSCPTLCDPWDGSPPGSPIHGILQARTLKWVAISFSNAWKWKVKVKSLSRVWLLATPWTATYQAPPSMGFSRQEYWNGVPLPSPATVHRAVKNRTWLKWLSMHKLWPIHM